MTAQEELVKYIQELTPEKLARLTARLPQLISGIEAQGIPISLEVKKHAGGSPMKPIQNMTEQELDREIVQRLALLTAIQQKACSTRSMAEQSAKETYQKAKEQ